ncbi:SDR family oxidoreductase [Arthrobacter sp. BHU FT2]|nr:SDR family oxidoreductase [Arthrobacter sp. BHU FT2]
MNYTPVAIVTGGGGGLGSTIARALTCDGFQVVLADRDHAAAESVAETIGETTGPRPVPSQVDITDSRSVASFADAVLTQFGRCDVVVNNAGVEPAMTLESATVEPWDFTMDVNLRGAMLVTQAFLPCYRKQGSASIINIASRAHIGGSRNPAYASSKAGLVGFTLSTAVDLGPIGVRSNAVSPSFVRTPFNEQRRDVSNMDEMIARYEAFTPLRRLITPEDVANTVAFLASEKARNITGQVIHVSAGSHLPPMA